MVVKKKNGQVQVCVDFQKLNSACPKDAFPLPITEMMIYATISHEIFSFMDESSGYNQIKMVPEEIDKMAFITPIGVYAYKVMPFGPITVGRMLAQHTL